MRALLIVLIIYPLSSCMLLATPVYYASNVLMNYANSLAIKDSPKPLYINTFANESAEMNPNIFTTWYKK